MPVDTFIPPMTLDEWELSIINTLVELNYPESDTLEFKVKIVNDIDKDICALANSSGGFIVFGINGKDRAEEKSGLPASEEHEISQQLTGKMAQIEPNPKFSTKTIIEGERLYVIMKVENISHLKPFISRNRGSFYIRLNGTTQPASRAIILNLFSDISGRRQKLVLLKNTIEILDIELSLRDRTGSFYVTRDYIQNIPKLDLSYIKSSIINAGELTLNLREFGTVLPGSYTGGLLTTVLPKLEEANANIRGFNNSIVGSEQRAVFANWLIEFGQRISGIHEELERCKVVINGLLTD